MHRSISLTFIVVLPLAGAILGPARADDILPPAAAAMVEVQPDATRVAAPDDGAAALTVAPAAADERPRWFQRVAPQDQLQALIVQPLIGGQLSSEFGSRRHPVLGTQETHDGVDYSAPRGTFVFAAADGTISFAGWETGYGNTIHVTHSDGVETVYAHLSRIEPGVATGAVVIQGYVIGAVGSTGMTTGPNLHFEVRVGGTPVDPLGLGETLRVAAMDRQMLARLRAE